MAKALEYPVVFKALLDGAYICSKTDSWSGKDTYTVNMPGQSCSMGHITEKQFHELDVKNIIELNIESAGTKDKYNNIYHCFYLKK